MGNRLSLLLLLLCLALGATIYHETRPDSTPAAAKRPQALPGPRPAAPAVAVEPRVPALSELTQTLDRPLFTADRKPPAAVDSTPESEIPAVAAAAPGGPSLELSAVVINGARRLALLQERGAGATMIHAEQGQTLDGGWLLKEVLPERVILSRGGIEHEIVLRKFQPPPAALLPAVKATAPATGGGDKAESLPQALDLRRPRRPLRGPRLRSRLRNQRE